MSVVSCLAAAAEAGAGGPRQGRGGASDQPDEEEVRRGRDTREGGGGAQEEGQGEGTATYPDIHGHTWTYSCRARGCWHLLTICDACVVGVQYQQLVRQQQEANRVLFETEKEQAVVDQKASEEYEEFRKKVGGVAQ